MRKIKKKDWLDRNIHGFLEFKNKNRELTTILNDTLTCYRLVNETALKSDLNCVSQLLIQEIGIIFMEGFELDMVGELTMSMTLYRTGTETARDVLRLLDDQSLMDLYLEGKTGTKSQRKMFHKTFKFDENSGTELALLNGYNLASNFGVHSRLPILTASSGNETPSEFTSLHVGKEEKRLNLQFWARMLHMTQSLLMSKLPNYHARLSEAHEISALWSRNWDVLGKKLDEKYS